MKILYLFENYSHTRGFYCSKFPNKSNLVGLTGCWLSIPVNSDYFSFFGSAQIGMMYFNLNFRLFQNLLIPNQKKILYSLYGVVEHSGSLNAGHYVAYVKVNSHRKKSHLNLKKLNKTNPLTSINGCRCGNRSRRIVTEDYFCRMVERVSSNRWISKT